MKDRAMQGLSEATERGKHLVESARETAERAGSYAQASVSRLSDRAQDVAGDLLHDTRASVERFTGRDVEAWTADLRRFVQERPLQAILATVAIGYILGKIIKR